MNLFTEVFFNLTIDLFLGAYLSDVSYDVKLEPTAPYRARIYTEIKFIPHRYLTYTCMAKNISMPYILALPAFHLTRLVLFFWKHAWSVCEKVIWYFNFRIVQHSSPYNRHGHGQPLLPLGGRPSLAQHRQ